MDTATLLAEGDRYSQIAREGLENCERLLHDAQDCLEDLGDGIHRDWVAVWRDEQGAPHRLDCVTAGTRASARNLVREAWDDWTHGGKIPALPDEERAWNAWRRTGEVVLVQAYVAELLQHNRLDEAAAALEDARVHAERQLAQAQRSAAVAMARNPERLVPEGERLRLAGCVEYANSLVLYSRLVQWRQSHAEERAAA
jgi:hypothetical protein